MSELGNAYVKGEWRLHRSVAEGEQLDQFLSEWSKYLAHLQETVRARDTVNAGVLDDVAGGSREDQPDVTVHPSSSLSSSEIGGNFKFGSDMPTDVQLSEEQLLQLAKLREEAQKAKKGS